MRPEKRAELIRLQKAFEREADQFHDLTLSVLYFTQELPASNRRFKQPNHVIMLWQYYETLESNADITQFLENLKSSNIARAGIRGSKFSCMAALEGDKVHNFIRMAMRAANVFSQNERLKIRLKAFNDFNSNLKSGEKRTHVTNQNALADCLNFILHHLGHTHPVTVTETRISLDPYAASLSAIDRLLTSPAKSIRKTRARNDQIEYQKFQVALSFPGEHRPFVEEVANLLRARLGHNSIFYDAFYKPQLARPNLDILLQTIYHHNSDLIVVFVCADYVGKEWCGLEWRAIRDIIKQRNDHKIMILRFDDAAIPGMFGIDGYIDVQSIIRRRNDRGHIKPIN